MSFTEVLDNLWNELAANKKLNSEHMNRFYCLFSEDFFSILSLLTEKSVKKLVTPSGRFLFRVYNLKDTANTDRYDYNYVLFFGNTCNCMKTQTASPRDGIHWCTHLIAAKVSAAIESYETVEINEEEYKTIFKKIIYNK